ncbi:MAG: hypothetical protein ACE5GJ_09935 [Gemmatimonadota bacterium]
MVYLPPPFPPGCPPHFRTTVHGTVFAGRDACLEHLRPGDPVRLLADPPDQDDPGVWVHLETGEPVGHLPPEIARWLWPWMREGGHARARALTVRGRDVPSWKRLTLQVECVTRGEE